MAGCRNAGGHYVRRWFIVEAVACIPLDIIIGLVVGIVLLPGTDASASALRMVAAAKCLKLLRLLRLVKSATLSKLVHAVGLPLMYMVVLMVVHWLSCG